MAVSSPHPAPPPQHGPPSPLPNPSAPNHHYVVVLRCRNGCRDEKIKDRFMHVAVEALKIAFRSSTLVCAGVKFTAVEVAVVTARGAFEGGGVSGNGGGGRHELPADVHSVASQLNQSNHRIVESAPLLENIQDFNIKAKPVRTNPRKKEQLYPSGEEKISFCLDEVNKCLGLPIEGKRKLDTKIHQDYPEFVHKYLDTIVQAGRKKKKDGSESIPARKMLESIIVLFDIENNSKTDFLRLCLLYMFNVFFFPTSDPNISLEHLKYLKDMTAFSEYAWGKIVWEHTLDGVKETRRRVEQGKNGRGYYIKGCLPLLEVNPCSSCDKDEKYKAGGQDKGMTVGASSAPAGLFLTILDTGIKSLVVAGEVDHEKS
ncbi:hypothetical protein RJ640_027291 [Escallonia rubra]|uniref:DUF1985 domain-containing protein n=1 Tax=Escallonia rubra TaxID=112253 RepID=A0AA88RR10_9ASTE|nr:hypothetical protein RJ640_027291 [Escallonia rubra]